MECTLFSQLLSLVQFFQIHPFRCMHLTVPSSVMWHGAVLTLRTKSTGLSDAEVAGKTLFLGVSVRVLWKGQHLNWQSEQRKSALTKAGGHHSPAEGLYRAKRRRKNELAL